MIEWLNKILMNLTIAFDQNASVILAAVIGSMVSVLAREERSILSALASFVSGVFAGWYLAQIAVHYIPIPIEPLAAVLAIMGRDLVRHIIKIGRENPLSLLNIGKKPPVDKGD
jgi:hypothetical protein